MLLTNTQDKILTVPFYSQYVDVKDPHWIIRSCGIISVKMALDYFGFKTPDPDSFIKEAVAMGAHSNNGWYHDGLVAVGEKYGIHPYRKEDMDMEAGLLELKDSIDQNAPVIVSVTQMLLGRKKYHQVLIVGYKESDGVLLGFYYHDPASDDRETGKNIYVNLDVFKVYWRAKAIFLKK